MLPGSSWAGTNNESGAIRALLTAGFHVSMMRLLSGITHNKRSVQMSALALPGEILLQCILVPFCAPRDLARVLAASRDLRSHRRACVTSLLENLFEGPGAANGISWVRLHHADKLDDISLVDWLYGIKDTAASGAYRASPGEKHTVVITPGGRALAAGNGRNGALGNSTNMNSFLFTEVDLRWGRFPGRIPVAAVACGHQHTLFLTAVGTVHSCGLGEYGRLGHGDEHSLSRPALIESLATERITQVAAGAAHSVAVTWEGEAFTWGWGFTGTLGHGNEIDCLKPTRVFLPDHAGPQDTSGAAGTQRDTHSTLGADDSTGEVAGCAQIERVTCAAAGNNRTVLGTSRGRVLNSVHVGLPIVSGAGFVELGRLPEGLRFWRVETSYFGWPNLTFAIDSAGHAHQFVEGTGNMRASFGSTPAGEGCNSCGDGVSLGSGGKGGEIVDRGQGCGQEGALHPVLAAPLRSPVSVIKCHSVFVSPSRSIIYGKHLSFVPDGVRGWGLTTTVVVVSDDGSLMTAASKWGGMHELRRRRNDGVVCAAVGLNQSEPSGLLVVDGGASLLTWGNAISGQLGHGHPQPVPTPTVVNSAFVLGSTLSTRNETRSSNVRVSLADNDRNIRPSAASSSGGTAAGKWPRREVFLLALVDAAADERDAREEPLDV